ncbi:DUF2269 domain-containing protein [Kitasatospora sp. HPMI-4]|uniref:DUF2269 domain-containing protein n=1 Tax=Kitasatospora sp. HPMI-4 TaxID=3448443 RepID=UPI003F1B9992
MTGTALSTEPRPADRRRGQLPPRARKSVVVAHVTSSVSWLALMLCLLTLGAAALATDDADTVRSSYRAMRLLGDVLVLPLSLLSLGSGLALSLWTPWGLFRYRWTTVKFWLTLAAAAASNIELTARLHDAARLANRHPGGSIAQMQLGFLRYNLVIIPTVALALYGFLVAVSVTKPWGRRHPTRRTAPT